MSTERLIIVGTDGSAGGRRALAWAVAHAHATGATVEVVTAWGWDGLMLAPGAIEGPEQLRALVERRQQEEVDEVLAGLADPPPVARTVVEGEPVSVLTRAARGADLLVLGSHGRSHLRTALLGSVSEGCIRKGGTPVVVIPAHDLPAQKGRSDLAAQAAAPATPASGS